MCVTCTGVLVCGRGYLYRCVGVCVTCTGVLVCALPVHVCSTGKAPGGQVEMQCPSWRSAGGRQEVQSSALPVVHWRQDVWHPGDGNRGVNSTEDQKLYLSLHKMHINTRKFKLPLLVSALKKRIINN